MAIKAEITTKTPCEVVVKATVGQEELKAAYESSLVKNSKMIELPGFRRGKAPRSMVEAKFKEYFEQEAMDDMINKVVKSLVKQYRLHVVTEMSVKDKPVYPAEGDFAFEVEFEVAPKVENINYTGLKLKGRKTEVTDEEVAKEIALAAERFATYEEVKTDRPAKFGDWSVCTYKATLGDKEVFKRDSAWVEVAQDRNTPAPGFCAEIAGMKKGETKTFELNSGAEFFMKEYRDQKLTFTVTLESIRERAVPEVNDELAAKIDPNIKTVDELKVKVKEAFTQNKAEIEQNRLCELAREQLVKNNPIPLPPYFVQAQTNNILRRELDNKMRGGMKEEELQKEAENLKPQCEERAKVDVAAEFIVSYIADKEKILLTADDIMPRLQEYARMFGRPVQWVFRMFEQSGKLDELRGGILQEKTLKFVVSKAEVTEQ